MKISEVLTRQRGWMRGRYGRQGEVLQGAESRWEVTGSRSFGIHLATAA